MNVTATLFGQMITFGVLIWFIARFLWEPMTQMMAARARRIADGLAAAEQGQRALEAAERQRAAVLDEARGHAAEILTQAEHQAAEIVEEARGTARTEAERILSQARSEVGQEVGRARTELRRDLARLVVAGVTQVVEREVDPAVHEALLNRLIEQL